jgi:hypothetical protein
VRFLAKPFRCGPLFAAVRALPCEAGHDPNCAVDER